MEMMKYRRHLWGDMAFSSFIPTSLFQIQVTRTPQTDRLIAEAETALRQLNADAARLSNEQLEKLMRQEAESSCRLASGEPSLSFDFMIKTDDDTLMTEAENLLQATRYAVEAMDELPLSARILKNAHYLMCQSEQYEKKYPGEFRNSPVWIGWKENGLKEALFVPPVYEDMTEAFSDLERYIHSEDTENVLVRAALIHYQFEMIHPFIDGNGRIGRLLNLLFLKQEEVLEKPVLLLSNPLYKRAAVYYRNIQRVNEAAGYDKWIDFFLTALKNAAQQTSLAICKME